MVGVPGKYKGCETCRLRRVKCDNQRPFCQKCIDSGRECAGYERETVFIIGTIEDQGRCSSHPPRVVKPRKTRGSPKENPDDSNFEITPREPLRPAWDDLIAVTCRGRDHDLQIASLYTKLQAVARGSTDGKRGDVLISLPPYEPPSVHPGADRDDFQLASQCLVHLAAPDQSQSGGTQTATDSICLFLYEHNTSNAFSNQPHWKDPSMQANAIKRLGPEYFRSFPAHHFFARVYRPTAVFTALLARTPTHLAEPHWLSTPYERHPKAPLDRLLDTVALLPALFYRADRILAQQHTITRRLMAQDLLHNCLDVEAALAAWFTSVQGSFFPTVAGIGSLNIPFAQNSYVLSFGDTPSALALTYYWATLVLLYPTMWRLYFAAVIDPVTVMQHHQHQQYHHPQHLHPHPHHQHPHHPHSHSPTPSPSPRGSHSPSPQPPSRQMTPIPPSPLPFPQPLPQPTTIPNPTLDPSLVSTTPATPTSDNLPVPPRLQALDAMQYALPRVRDAAAHAGAGLAFLAGVAAEVGGGGSATLPPASSGSSNACVQPDLLWQPLFIVRRFYEDVRGMMPVVTQPVMGGGMGRGAVVGGVIGGAGSGSGGGGAAGSMDQGDGSLEVMWCEGIAERVAARAREMQQVVQGRGWVDLASF